MLTALQPCAAKHKEAEYSAAYSSALFQIKVVHRCLPDASTWPCRQFGLPESSMKRQHWKAHAQHDPSLMTLQRLGPVTTWDTLRMWTYAGYHPGFRAFTQSGTVVSSSSMTSALLHRKLSPSFSFTCSQDAHLNTAVTSNTARTILLAELQTKILASFPIPHWMVYLCFVDKLKLHVASQPQQECKPSFRTTLQPGLMQQTTVYWSCTPAKNSVCRMEEAKPLAKLSVEVSAQNLTNNGCVSPHTWQNSRDTQHTLLCFERRTGRRASWGWGPGAFLRTGPWRQV